MLVASSDLVELLLLCHRISIVVDGRIVGPVGRVPRGLESVVSETLSRLDTAGKKPRIPVEVVRTRQGLRVDLLMGETR